MTKPGSKRKSQHRSLSYGRPPGLWKPNATPSAHATRSRIRSYHTLNKTLSRALANGDEEAAASLNHQIAAQGGLKSYQAASITGQSAERGGDSSKVLAAWLEPALKHHSNEDQSETKIQLLDVGALSRKTVIAKNPNVVVTAIDLNSQEKGILQQDFMERPLPRDDSAKFDVISLSLVLNYVPSAKERGDMLKRTREFFRPCKGTITDTFPCLFIVLPAPCTSNSRYMNDVHFSAILESLGFDFINSKTSDKLVYSLWRFGGKLSATATAKIEVNPGKRRNNFSIILDADNI